MNIGDNIKYQRKIRQKTLNQIANDTNISRQNLSRYERNEVIPSIIFCIKLADYYQISLDELVGRDFF